MHVAIIMDGNGRWATVRGLPRSAGHASGVESVRAAIGAALRAGVKTLTLYAFSAANWNRPVAEVDGLMRLFREFFVLETQRCVEQRIRINVIGRRDRLPAALVLAIERSERRSAAGSRLHLRIVIDYSSRESILQAAGRVRRGASVSAEEFGRLLHKVDHSMRPATDVDLLIRTGGERRLSDFMLWELAHAELHFTDCPWPEFDAEQFQHALNEFARRQRRFGTLSVEKC